MASRATSIRCRSVSPSPRSATPFPTIIGGDHLKKTNELLTQEVALLRARVVSLELELEKAKEEAQEESAKCKAANELIEWLRQQLETTTLPSGGGSVQVGRNTPSENVNNRDQGRVRFRWLEMYLRRRDIELWMSNRSLPEHLRRRIRESERYNWSATRGVNEETLMENLPEDVQRDIRRHLFKFVKKVRLFCLMDEPIVDAIYKRLRQTTYIKGDRILYPGGLIDRMVFIVQGKIETVGRDGTAVRLSEWDVCGEELLPWCLEHSYINKEGNIRISGRRLLSDRMVSCLTNVEAYILQATDLGEVAYLFPGFFRNPRLQGAIRYESPYWRGLAAKRIQVAWKYYRKKRLGVTDTSVI